VLKFLGSNIIHWYILPKNTLSVNLMRFALYYNKNGDRKLILFSVAFMQYLSSFSIEMYSIWKICYDPNIENGFINLLAFVFVSNLEEAVAGFLQQNIAKGLLSEGVTLNFERVTG
jgi:hypothetical protein